MSEIETSICAKCGQPAKLQCPDCKKLNCTTPASFYCSQDCFKQVWKEHKKTHPEAWMYVTKKGAGRQDTCPSFPWTGPLRPLPVSPTRSVPKEIAKPDYAKHPKGWPVKEMDSPQQQIIVQRGKDDVEGLREACRLARQVLDAAACAVRVGMTTDAIDDIVHRETIARGAYPSPLNYFNFPKSVCTSVNEVICHGIPDERPLQDGDIVNIDVSLYYNGYHGDLNETYTVGAQCSDEVKALVKVTYECLLRAIKACKPGVPYSDIGSIISKHASKHNVSVVKTYCGHGIGNLFHCAPNVPHYAGNKAKGVMKVGHTFTIEPMINLGSHRDVTWPDGWTAVTEDGRASAQFEHTLLITETGVEVLTARTEQSPKLWWEVEGVGLDLGDKM